MKYFKLSRKEKLLFATPLLLPLLVLAWPQVSADGMDRTLRELAGPQAVDCGNSPHTLLMDPCAIAVYKAGKPFIVRQDVHPRAKWGIVATPQGQVYLLSYTRQNWRSLATLQREHLSNAKVSTTTTGASYIQSEDRIEVSATRVWW